MTGGQSRPLAYARGQRRRLLADLTAFARIPSISADPARAADVRRCAAWVADHLRRIGLPRVEVVTTRRHPVVLAATDLRADRPTVLLYGHYDVQPVDPVSEWRNPPFSPTVSGEEIRGRGVSDNKGQLLAHFLAIEAFLAGGDVPVNVVVLLDGEEEIGSPNLAEVLAARREMLCADVAVVSDTRMLGPDQPALTSGLRGSMNLELDVRGPAADLHSGAFGGAVHNPLQALCEIVATLHDAHGRVNVPGFYAGVRNIGAAERHRMARAGPTDEQFRTTARAPAGWGEPGWSLFERTTVRPAITLNGIVGGHQGPGPKSVIPGRATAKINVRLVQDQQAASVASAIRSHVGRRAPPTVRWRLRVMSASPPVIVDRTNAGMHAAAAAYCRVFGRPPLLVPSGGSIPGVGIVQRDLRVPVVLMGFALPDDNMHAPNERLHLPTLWRAVETCIWFYTYAGRALTTSAIGTPAAMSDRARN